MNKKVCIVAIIYTEPEWAETKACIESCGVPVFYADRLGVGNMSKAYNDCFNGNPTSEFEYTWFLSNVTFSPECLPRLIDQMERTKFTAIHPSFDSDHKHTRPAGVDKTLPVPFIEFTGPIVRTEHYQKVQLDELMPYWGHDLDWGFRTWKAGGRIGVYHGIKYGHSYIRNNTVPHPDTIERRLRRKQTDHATRLRLAEKYSDSWRNIVWPKRDTEIVQFYHEVVKSQFPLIK